MLQMTAFQFPSNSKWQNNIDNADSLKTLTTKQEVSKKVNNMLSNWEKGDNDFQEMDRWAENRLKHNAVGVEVNFIVPCCLVDSRQG